MRRWLIGLVAWFAVSSLNAFSIDTDGAPKRLAVFASQSGSPYDETERAILARLSVRGFRTELKREVLAGDKSAQRLQLTELLAFEPDLLITIGTPATELAAREHVSTPLLATLIVDTRAFVGATNATAIYLEFPVDLQLQWLRRLLPQARRLAVVYGESVNELKVASAAEVAEKLGLQLQASRLDSPTELPATLMRLEGRTDALWGISDAVVFTPQTAKPLLMFSLERKIALVGLSMSWVKAGALYALDRDYTDIGEQCADFATRILNGTAPGEIPPEPPRKVLYAVNQRVARSLGIRFSDDVLRSATRVFE
jgi:putative ABC transport system substrate-binding protein